MSGAGSFIAALVIRIPLMLAEQVRLQPVADSA